MVHNKLTRAKVGYGLTQECFATSKSDGETIVMGGVGPEAHRWARVLTRRAAQNLWFQLTRILFPEKSAQVTSMAQTAALRPSDQPTLTTHLEVIHAAEGHAFDILGWVGEDTWWFRVDDHNARRLWAALDVALYPAGWQGPLTHHNKIN